MIDTKEFMLDANIFSKALGLPSRSHSESCRWVHFLFTRHGIFHPGFSFIFSSISQSKRDFPSALLASCCWAWPCRPSFTKFFWPICWLGSSWTRFPSSWLYSFSEFFPTGLGISLLLSSVQWLDSAVSRFRTLSFCGGSLRSGCFWCYSLWISFILGIGYGPWSHFLSPQYLCFWPVLLWPLTALFLWDLMILICTFLLWVSSFLSISLTFFYLSISRIFIRFSNVCESLKVWDQSCLNLPSDCQVWEKQPTLFSSSISILLFITI